LMILTVSSMNSCSQCAKRTPLIWGMYLQTEISYRLIALTPLPPSASVLRVADAT
jgi:hypothetical protein